MCHSKVYVSCSRVRTKEDLRFLPGITTGNFNHLICLKPNEELLKWLKGFNKQTGYWERRLCDSHLTTARH